MPTPSGGGVHTLINDCINDDEISNTSTWSSEKINDEINNTKSELHLEIQAASPVNLLDNSDFTNPVNQRGQTSYNNGYTIDRWKSDNEHINLIVGNGKITLSKSQSGGNFEQPLPFDTIGKKFTIAVKTGDGVFVNNFLKSESNVLKQIPGLNAYFGVAGSGKNSRATIYFNANDSIDLDLYWMALYEGEYTAETLPEYRQKGYAAELAECMRYYRKIPSGVITYVPHYEAAPGMILSTPMRIIPTITIYDNNGTPNMVSFWEGNGSPVTYAYANSVFGVNRIGLENPPQSNTLISYTAEFNADL